MVYLGCVAFCLAVGLVAAIRWGRALHRSREQFHRKASEKIRELEDGERKFRRLVEGLPDDYFFYSTDTQGTLIYVSPSVEHVLGYRPGQVVGRNWREFVGESSLEKVAELERQRFAGRVMPRFEAELRHQDGSARYLEMRDVPVVGQDGSIVLNEGVAKDITHRKESERKLRRDQRALEWTVEERTSELRLTVAQLLEEIRIRQLAQANLEQSEARHRAIVRDQTEFIVRWKPDGTVTFMSDSYRRYFNLDAESTLGTSFLPRVSDEQSPALGENIRRLVPEEPARSDIVRVRVAEEQWAWHEWTTRAIFDTERRLIEYQSVGRDITPQREAEARLREQEAVLAHVSRLSTMGELVAGIAHEVNQPLYSITNFAKASSNVLANAEHIDLELLRQWNDDIRLAAQRAGEIIKRLRAFVRRAEAERQPADINEIVAESVELVGFEARRRQVQVELQLAEKLPSVAVDRVQIQQVMVNLLKNAYEAMDEAQANPRRVTVSTLSRTNAVEVIVQDTGPGVPENLHVFDAFVTTKPDGMGMGLAISHTIIDAHGGKLWLERTELPGAEFHFTLALAPSDK